MKRRVLLVTAFASLLHVASATPPASALDEADRLWMVGDRASADGLPKVARRALERFVAEHPTDPRLPDAVLLLGRARLATGDAETALEAFRRAQGFTPPPGRPLEVKFWEAEALFRLKRFAEARAAYDAVVRTDAASPLAPDAVYGLAWSESELGHAETAVDAFRQFLQTWPDHATAPSATFHLARVLVELKRFKEALPLLEEFTGRYRTHAQAPDARYLLGLARIETGDTRGGVADLRAFAEAHPTHPQTRAARQLVTRTLARHGNRSELGEVYKTLMAESPATPDGLYDAASVAGRLGRAKEQEAALRRLRGEFPDHALSRRAALELASVAYKRKDWKDTVAQAEAATKSGESAVRAEAWLLVGEGELKLKRFQNAEKAFEAAGAVKEAKPAIRFRALAGLGLAHEEQREWKPALTAYEAVADKSPDATLRDWARERATAVKERMASAPPDTKPPEQKAPEKTPAVKTPPAKTPAEKKPTERKAGS
ncbi:MAG TPA: tetratricopeptide repeat protein [Methylomirabilota bacterium]|nr:tetratricopeptide repeat protein [Methylomirabilota bacterium]